MFRKKSAHKGLLAVSMLCFLITGCSKIRDHASDTDADGGAMAPDDPHMDQPVAMVGKQKITVGELTEILNRQDPRVRTRFASLERKKEFLKNLVRLEVLLVEARKRGLEKDPEVVRQVKRVMVNQLMERLNKELVKFEDISDKDVEDFYMKNIKLYKRPATVRASAIMVKSLNEAQRIMALAKKKPEDARYFAELVKEHSIDSDTKSKGGDLGFFDKEVKHISKSVVESVFKIQGLWNLDGPVKTERGYVVLLKTGESPEINRPLELEKDRIKNRVFNERRISSVNEFIERLHDQAKVTINEGNLAKVKIERPTSPMDGNSSP
ncbi:MAG: peptidyl-prolyl cis-trans isomerase [Pseudomonadota bacterium]